MGSLAVQEMLTLYHGNFTRVLNRIDGSEAMPSKKISEEHTLDVTYKITSDGPG